MTYNYNRFKDTTIFGNLYNKDSPSGINNADAIFDRNLTVNGSIITPSLMIGTPSINSTLINYIENSPITFTKITKANTPPTGDNTQYIATTEFVTSSISALSLTSLYARLTSPIFNGVPTSPNTILGTNSLQIANTNFVQNAINNLNIGNYALTTALNSAISNIYSQTLTPFSSLQTFNNGITIASNKILTLNTGAIISANGVQVSDINLSYLNGCTSNIQSQITNYNTVQHGWTALQVFRLGVNILTNTTLQLGTGANISTNGLTITDVELGYLDGATSNLQSQINAIIPFSTGGTNTWIGASNTFNNIVNINGNTNLNGIVNINNTLYLDNTNQDTSIINLMGGILNFYGKYGFQLYCGGTTGFNSFTTYFNLSSLTNTCDISCPLSVIGSTTNSGSIKSKYLSTYNNVTPSITPMASNFNVLQTPFTYTSLNPIALNAISSSLISNVFTIPANYNNQINFSIPVSWGVLSGTMNNTTNGSIAVNSTITSVLFQIFDQTNGGVLLSSNIPNNTFNYAVMNFVSTNNTVGVLLSYSFLKSIGNFTYTFIPPFLETSNIYTFKLSMILSTAVTHTAGFTVCSGTPYIQFNSSTLTYTQINMGTGNLGSYGNAIPISIVSQDINNTLITTGTTYLNNLISYGTNTISSNPFLSYITLPSYTSNQIGYNVPITYTIGTGISNGVFTILAKTTAPLSIGNYNIYWTTGLSNTGANGIVVVGMYGVIFSSSIPTAFTGSSYTNVHNQTAYNNQNQLYTSSCYVSPSTANFNAYLCVNLAFSGVTITSNNLSNLQVIRTS